jgi:hypothetical protein
MPVTKSAHAKISSVNESNKTEAIAPRQLQAVIVNRTGNKIVVGVTLEAQGDEVGRELYTEFQYNSLEQSAKHHSGSGASGAD